MVRISQMKEPPRHRCPGWNRIQKPSMCASRNSRCGGKTKASSQQAPVAHDTVFFSGTGTDAAARDVVHETRAQLQLGLAKPLNPLVVERHGREAGRRTLRLRLREAESHSLPDCRVLLNPTRTDTVFLYLHITRLASAEPWHRRRAGGRITQQRPAPGLNESRTELTAALVSYGAGLMHGSDRIGRTAGIETRHGTGDTGGRRRRRPSPCQSRSSADGGSSDPAMVIAVTGTRQRHQKYSDARVRGTGHGHGHGRTAATN